MARDDPGVDRWFDFAITSLSKDKRTVRTEFRRGPRPTGAESASAAREMLNQGESLGILSVIYEDATQSRPTAVTLENASGITPSQLARFPWAHWMTAADEIVRTGMPPVPTDRLAEAIRAGAGRPGRRGHPDSFFENVARRYRELRLDGHRAPVATIAGEAGVSRNTAAGWVKRARERGLLSQPRHL